MPRMKPERRFRVPGPIHIGLLATLRRDGRPYTVPIWFLHYDDAFWITGTYDRVWCKQLFQDPRASLASRPLQPSPAMSASTAPLPRTGGEPPGHDPEHGLAVPQPHPEFVER